MWFRLKIWAKSNVDIWSIWKSQWQLKALTLQSHINTRTHSAAGSSHLSKCEQQYLHLAGGCGEGRLSGLLTFFLHWLWSGVWGVRSFFFNPSSSPFCLTFFSPQWVHLYSGGVCALQGTLQVPDKELKADIYIWERAADTQSGRQ